MRPSVVAELENQIHGSAEQRYGRRLHAILLVERGMSYPATARLLGDSPRTIARWVHRYNDHGLAGLRERPKGRPRRLTRAQNDQIRAVIAWPERGGSAAKPWTAPALAEWIDQRYHVRLSDRQCRRLLSESRIRGVIDAPAKNCQY
jgi:transposase